MARKNDLKRRKEKHAHLLKQDNVAIKKRELKLQRRTAARDNEMSDVTSDPLAVKRARKRARRLQNEKRRLASKGIILKNDDGEEEGMSEEDEAK